MLDLLLLLNLSVSNIKLTMISPSWKFKSTKSSLNLREPQKFNLSRSLKLWEPKKKTLSLTWDKPNMWLLAGPLIAQRLPNVWTWWLVTIEEATIWLENCCLKLKSIWKLLQGLCLTSLPRAMKKAFSDLILPLKIWGLEVLMKSCSTSSEEPLPPEDTLLKPSKNLESNMSKEFFSMDLQALEKPWSQDNLQRPWMSKTSRSWMDHKYLGNLLGSHKKTSESYLWRQELTNKNWETKVLSTS